MMRLILFFFVVMLIFIIICLAVRRVSLRSIGREAGR